jgi:hypothetical protein
MTTHLREKKRRKRQTQPVNDPSRTLTVDSHTNPGFSIIRFDSVDPFDTAPFKLEAYMHDLLKHCMSFYAVLS